MDSISEHILMIIESEEIVRRIQKQRDEQRNLILCGSLWLKLKNNNNKNGN